MGDLSVRDRSGGVIVTALAVILLATHVQHGMAERESLQSILFGILIPALLASGLLAGGLWLWRTETSRMPTDGVGFWTLVGTVVMTVAALMTVLYQSAEGVQMSHPLYVLANTGSAGGVAGFIVGIYDARQREARSKLQSARDRSQRLNNRLSILNRVLRHDIRNKANVILARTTLLDTDSEHARKIRRQTQELVNLGDHARSLEELLRSEDSDREAVDVAAVVESVVERLEREYPTAEIQTEIPARAPVLANPLVTSALENVIENGIEHNDKETPQIVVTCDRYTSNGDRIAITIADNGPGFDEAEIEILERGYETSLEHSSGLGLWVVNWFVESANGEVEFEENDPEGSVVRLTFDAANPVDLDADTVAESTTNPGSELASK